MNSVLSTVFVANKIRKARSVCFFTGAGCSADSGIPTFRDAGGFWNGHPQFAGLDYRTIMSPHYMRERPDIFWAAIGTMQQLFRAAEPHPGYRIMKRWVDGKPGGGFAVTSNVDGMLQKAGFPEQAVLEIHGSKLHFQCDIPCCDELWEAETVPLNDDGSVLPGSVPKCPYCGGMARPNVVLFDDDTFLSVRKKDQGVNFEAFRAEARKGAVAVVEIGAGTAIPSIRMMAAELAASCHTSVIRINTLPEVGPGVISMAGSAAQVMQQLNRFVLPCAAQAGPA